MGGQRIFKTKTAVPVLTSQSARAPLTELEGSTAGVTNVGHGHDVDALARQPVVTFGEVTTIEVT
jgi:hypothetical protein